MAQQNYLQSGLNLTNVNPAELEPEALQNYQKIIQDQIKALEERYKEPNWFKVAAGFAKPQLGGFFASLGSASEALGENVEKEREQMLPLSQMKIAVEQANMLIGQKQKQNNIYQEWLKKNTNPDGTVQPMDAATYSRIMSLGDKTEVAQAATKYYEGAQAGLNIATAAAAASGKDPRLQLDDFLNFQVLNPHADQKQIKSERDKFINALNLAKPPQIDPAQWNAMSLYEKMEISAQYANAQREAGMRTEGNYQQLAQQAPDRLKLLSSIRNLALGVDLQPSEVMVDGKKVMLTGQQQMDKILNKFGGNNPFEVLARAAADGKLGETLRDLDKYAIQSEMSPGAKDHFQKLVKLLAENQVNLRNSSANPTDAAALLQAAGSPGIGNSQTALVSLVDLMGHKEQHNIENYKYIVNNEIPTRKIAVDPGFLDLQRKFGIEHGEYATKNPLLFTPSWYNPARSNKEKPAQTTAPESAPSKPESAPAKAAAPQNAPAKPAATAGSAPARPNEIKGSNGNRWVRQGNQWVDTKEPFK